MHKRVRIGFKVTIIDDKDIMFGLAGILAAYLRQSQPVDAKIDSKIRQVPPYTSSEETT